MLKVARRVPLAAEEFVVVERMTRRSTATAAGARPRRSCVEFQRQADAVYVDPAVIEYAVRLATRPAHPASVGLPDLARYLSFGASPRASINLVLAAQGAGLPARP